MTTITKVTTMPRTGFKGLVNRHPLITMYVIMFTLAWSVMIPQAMASQGRLPQPPIILDILVGWAPGIAALIVTAFLSGSDGVRDLFRRFLVWRVGWQWYLIGLFLLALVILGGIGMQVAFGGTVPTIPAAGASLLNIALSFVVLVLAGFLLNTEEIAWRGFALPRLQARYSVLGACFLLALPEALLHLPLFWNKSIDFYQTVGIFWFTAFSVAAVFIYVYIFNMTRGSLIIVTLLHASQNAWANLLSDNTLPPFIFTVALLWMIALALIFFTRGQLGYESGQ